MLELLIVILLVLLVASFVAPRAGHPLPGGSVFSIVLFILLVLVVLALFGGVDI